MPTGVEFEEDSFGRAQRPGSPGSSGRNSMGGRGMSGWLVRKGIVKSSGGAQGVLVVIIIICLVVTFVMVKYFL